MNSKIIISIEAILFTSLIISCSVFPKSTSTLIPTPSLLPPSPTFTIVSTSMPNAAPSISSATAMPIKDPSNQDELERIIFYAFGKEQKCFHSVLKFENERKEAGNPIFIEKDSQYSSTALAASTIIENQSKAIQAFVACMPFGPDPHTCADRVIVREKGLNKVYDISFWTQAANRLTYLYTWVGNDILMFSQNNGATESIIAINIRTQQYAYLGLYFYDCR